MTTNNRTLRQIADQNLIDGLKKHMAAIVSLILGGQTFTNAEMVQMLEPMVAASNAAVTTRVIWRTAVMADRDLRAKNRQFVRNLKQTLASMFQGQPTVLADFGLAPPKTPVIAPKTRVAAAAKARATREARGTKGAVQRAAIEGNVTGIVVTPVTAPSPAPVPGPVPGATPKA
jgi:hypothetical protein